MKQVTVKIRITLTDEQYEREDFQDFLDDARTGAMVQEMNLDLESGDTFFSDVEIDVIIEETP